MTTGIELIQKERGRQIREEGFDAQHDSEFTCGELEAAGACYALFSELQAQGFDLSRDDDCTPRQFWPWDLAWWKPKTRLQNLVRAGALIAAAIDKLLADRV